MIFWRLSCGRSGTCLTVSRDQASCRRGKRHEGAHRDAATSAARRGVTSADRVRSQGAEHPPEKVKAQILSAGGEQVADPKLMRRHVYDIVPGDTSKWIRLRDTGTETTLCVKEIRDDGIDGTLEVETAVGDFAATSELLSMLGFSYYRCWSPVPVPLAKLISVAVARERIEEDHQQSKQVSGLAAARSPPGPPGTAGSRSACSPTSSSPAPPPGSAPSTSASASSA